MKIILSLTLSAYMLDRFSTRSVMASLLFKMTISRPKSRRYRISVPFRGHSQDRHAQNDLRERTIMIGQRGGVFPDRDSRGEIEDVSQNGITLGTRGIRQRGFLPSNENEDENSKQQGI